MPNSDSPLVSIILPVYNGEKYLREAIDSMLSQTFARFEFVIINDGSTDGSMEIINSYTDDRIRTIHQDNMGLAKALNNGIDKAQARYIARMDADDISLPDRLEVQYRYLEEYPDVVALGCAVEMIDADGEPVCIFRNPSSDQVLRDRLPAAPFVHPAVMFRKEAYIAAGRYPEHLKHAVEDTVLFGRIAREGKITNLSDILLKYRITPGAMSRKPLVFRHVLQDISMDAIQGNEVSAEALDSLDQWNTRLSADAVSYYYHLEVAKLLIWSGQDSSTARRHLKSCTALRPWWRIGWFMYFISLFPSVLVNVLYRRIKSVDILPVPVPVPVTEADSHA